jgi:hypothetical protein
MAARNSIAVQIQIHTDGEGFTNVVLQSSLPSRAPDVAFCSVGTDPQPTEWVISPKAVWGPRAAQLQYGGDPAT